MNSDFALLTTDEMAECDRLAIKRGTPGIDLMEAAGRGVAESAAAIGEVPVHVLCGPGNNGGDGFVAARILKEAGRDVRVFLLGDLKALKGDAAIAASTWKDPVRAVSPHAVQGAGVIIDALFGAGLSRPIDGTAETIAAINEADAHVIAVDVPSGMDGTSGAVLGPTVEADETVTFFRAKPGHFLYPGRKYCGPITVIDIGIPTDVLDIVRPRTALNGPDVWLDHFPWPEEEGHKYGRGHALIISGDELHTGASRLAAQAALRVGAGLVTLAGTRDALRIHGAQVSDVMLEEAADAGALAELLKDERKNAVLIGPAAGISTQTRSKTRTVLDARRATVLDADVFSAYADAPTELFKFTHDGCVLTPHEGEFERVFPGILGQEGSRLGAARAGAATSRSVVLLKGPDTIVAARDGHAVININAPPTLATAGSGDVLSGIITGLLAQGMPPFYAAAASAWIHGEAANLFGLGLVASDLPDLVPEVLESIFELAFGTSD